MIKRNVFYLSSGDNAHFINGTIVHIITVYIILLN